VLPSAPIPFDAVFEMLEFDDQGAESVIGFWFSSSTERAACYQMKVQEFFALLKRHADGLIPLDAELDGIEVSQRFTVILLRVKSDHFPPHAGNELPLAHLRYEAGQLQLLNVFESVAKDRRIQISSKR
jgi:hypothetical protein